MTTTISASNPVSTGDKLVQTPTDSRDRNAESVHALVVLARDGDDVAWELLFRRSYPRLLAYAARRLPTAEMAKDAVSETITRAVANIDRLRFDGGGFDAWLYGIARYVVIDAQRKMRREAPGVVPDAADVRPLPSDHALQGEDTDEVRAAFAQLNSTDQEVLELRVVANLSVEEVSSVLGRRPGAVRMAQSRALERLRHIMLKNGEVAVVGDDERLLQLLAQALDPGSDTPSTAELEIVRRAAAFLREQADTARGRLAGSTTQHGRREVGQPPSVTHDPPPDQEQKRRLSPTRRKPRMRIRLLSS